MIRRLKKYLILGVLFYTLLGVTSCQLTKSNNSQLTENTYKTNVVNENKVLEKESVVQSVNELCRLEVLQIQQSKVITIKQGKYFTKEKSIKLYANCKFTLDLEKIKSENILISGNEIMIFCSDPELEVILLEDMTEFSDTKKSFLTFSDLKLTSESWNSILLECKISIQEETSKYIDEAKVKAENSIEKALLKLTKSDYTISIRWVE